MAAGQLAYIDTPAQGNRRPDGVTWCADNGAFSDKWDADKWWSFLVKNADRASTCRFAVAPDVVGDAAATLERSRPWLAKIRALGYPVAFVGQNGLEDLETPWDEFDCLFLGGGLECVPCRYVFREARRPKRGEACPTCGQQLTEWKLGAAAAELVAEAKRRGKWVHMGRVNSYKRLAYAESIGCDSADGTYLTFGPAKNLPKLLGWLDRLGGQLPLAA